MKTVGNIRPTHDLPALMTDRTEEGEVVITVNLPHLHATETLRALSEWNLRYSLSAWQVSWSKDGESCSLLLQMVAPYRSPSSPEMTAPEATARILKSLRQHWSRYGAKVNVDVVQAVNEHLTPALAIVM